MIERAFATLDAVAKVCAILAGVAMVVLTAIFGWLVFGRYVLNATPTWVEQAALLLVASITFLGAAVGYWEERHLRVTLFVDRAPALLRRLALALGHGIMAVFGLVMATQSYQLARFKWSVEIPLLGLPEGLRAVPIALCGALIFLFSLAHLAKLARERSN